MRPLPEGSTVREHALAAQRAATKVLSLIDYPAGHPPEQLEDALNLLQDEGFQARRAYRNPDAMAEAAS